MSAMFRTTEPSEFILITAAVAVNDGMAGALCRVATPLPILRPVRALVLGLLRGESAVVDRRRGGLEAGQGVPGLLGDDLTGHRDRARLEQVPLAELQGVHPDGLGHQLHVPLEPPEELHVAEAAVGRPVGLVGVDRVGVDARVRQLVGTGGGESRRAGHVDGVVGVGTRVPEHRHLLGGDAAVGAHAGLDPVGQRAAAGQQAELLLSGRLEPDGSTAGLAGEAGHEGFEVDAGLAAEAAADVWDDHPNLVQRQPHRGAEEVADGERRLGAGPDRDLVACLPLHDHHMGLQRHVLHRGVGVLALDDPLGLGEPLLDVALADLLHVGEVRSRLRAEDRLDVAVAAELGVDQRRIRLEGDHRVEHRCQDLVLDVDQLDGLGRDLRALGGDRGDRLAEVAHHVLGEDVLVDDVEADLVVELVAGEHGVHARKRLGPRGVDAQDAGAGVRAVLDLRVEHRRQQQVPGVERVAGELLGRLDPRVVDADRRSDGRAGAGRVVLLGEQGHDVVRHTSGLPSKRRRADRRRRGRPRRSARSRCTGRSCPRCLP